MSDTSVKQSLSEFYQLNNFEADGGVSNLVSWAKVGPFTFPILNLKSRKKALIFHDLHHLITGYQTNMRGEAEISAWEIASGGWGRLWYIWGIVLSGFAFGVAFYPKTTKKAFDVGNGCRNAYASGIKINDLLNLELNELRDLTQTKNHSHRSYSFWAILSVALITIPPTVIILLVFS